MSTLSAEEQAVVQTVADWVDREVSTDPRYFNSNLSIKPFSTWK